MRNGTIPSPEESTGCSHDRGNCVHVLSERTLESCYMWGDRDESSGESHKVLVWRVLRHRTHKFHVIGVVWQRYRHSVAEWRNNEKYLHLSHAGFHYLLKVQAYHLFTHLFNDSKPNFKYIPCAGYSQDLQLSVILHKSICLASSSFEFFYLVVLIL